MKNTAKRHLHNLKKQKNLFLVLYFGGTGMQLNANFHYVGHKTENRKERFIL